MVYGTEHSNQNLFWTGNLKHEADLRLKFKTKLPFLTYLAWAVCFPIGVHVMILSRIPAFKFLNSRMCMNE